jgi:hypothetical protein
MANSSINYLAGIFDGEGWVSVEKYNRQNNPRYNLCAGVANTFVPVLEEFKTRWGGGIYSQGKHVNLKVWTWRVSSRKAYVFLTNILRYCWIKRPKVEIGIAYLRGISNYRGYPRVPQEELDKREAFRQQIMAA